MYTRMIRGKVLVHFKYSEFLSPAPTPSDLCVLSFRTVVREKKGKPEKSKKLVEETELFVCVCVCLGGGRVEVDTIY